MRVQFEAWFVNAKVDIVFSGHVHAYERTVSDHWLVISSPYFTFIDISIRKDFPPLLTLFEKFDEKKY